MSVESSVSIIIVLIIVSILIFGPLAVLWVLMIRDTIRKRGKWGINMRPVDCTQCGTPMPMMFRVPTNWRQAMWGGWTCPECGLDLDKWGRPVEGQTAGKWAVLRAVEEIEEGQQQPRRHDERIHNLNDQTQRGDA